MDLKLSFVSCEREVVCSSCSSCSLVFLSCWVAIQRKWSGGCKVRRWLDFKNLVPAHQVSTLGRSMAALAIPTAVPHMPAVEGRSWEELVPDCRGNSERRQQQWFPEHGKLGMLVLGPEEF